MFEHRYRDSKRVASDKRADLYQAVRDDERAAIIKRYLPAPDAADRARHEYHVLTTCAHAGIPEAFELDLSQPRPALAMEYVPGVPLSTFGRGLPLLGIDEVMDLAIEWADILACIHAARLIHRRVQPANLLVDRGSGCTHLIGFGWTRPLGSEEHDPTDLATLDEMLPYIAPEQTGRMNRGCDSRSDLYALGATLYFALTGGPPFEGDGPLEVIHAHMAREPMPPHELRPQIPSALSQLVLKLLAKQPEERYQSARALHRDLIALRQQLARGAVDANFVLAAGDVEQRPHWRHALFGREAEHASLVHAFQRAAEGRVEVVWIEGQAGSGKSALVDALRPVVSGVGGYLVSGKFDLYSERPYAGWTAALSGLAVQMLVESDARLAQWRVSLQGALGSIAQALIHVVPDLAHVLGDVAPIPAVGPRETQLRLALALQRLLSVVATREHPLVLFLDDLQWSDSGSRFLLEQGLSALGPKALLLIGAYREEAIASDGPLPKLIERLDKRGIASETLHLGPLSLDASIDLLASALTRARSDVAPLAEHVERKTGNLPLLIVQFVEYLHDCGLLRHAPETGWTWDAEAISTATIPEGAVALMTAKIERLDADVRRVLAFASCVGDQLGAQQLAELCDRDVAGIEAALFALADTGLITPAVEGFRFSHDRIREAAQAGLSTEDRARLHADTGRLLLERTPPEQREARAFEIADHLNRGRTHLGPELRMTAIELNLSAGQRALRAGAAAEAAHYLAQGCEQLCEEDWRTQRALGFRLYMSYAESAFSSRDFARALELLDLLEQRSPSRLELAAIAALRVRVWTLLKPPEEGARYLLRVLRQLGVRWPLHPSRWRTRLTVSWTARQLRSRERGELMRPAEHLDAEWIAPVRLIDAAGGALARIDGYLIALLSSFILRRYLRFGYVSSPAFNLASFATFAHAVLQDGRLARRWVELGHEWIERVPDPVYGARAAFQLALTSVWLMPRSQALAPMPMLAERLFEAGDVEFAYYALFQHTLQMGLGGAPIQQIAEAFTSLIQRVQRAGHHYPNPEGCFRAYRLLQASALEELDLEREVEQAEVWLRSYPGTAETIIRTFWMMVLCIYRREDLALQQTRALAADVLRVLPFGHVADQTFYRGLAAATLAQRARGRERRRYRKELASALGRLRRWAHDAPDLAHMVTFLEAEIAVLGGQAERAPVLYANAARAAQQQQFLHNAALAQERSARILARSNRITDAARSYEDSIALYRRWGAVAKADALEREAREAGWVSKRSRQRRSRSRHR